MVVVAGSAGAATTKGGGATTTGTGAAYTTAGAGAEVVVSVVELEESVLCANPTPALPSSAAILRDTAAVFNRCFTVILLDFRNDSFYPRLRSYRPLPQGRVRR